MRVFQCGTLFAAISVNGLSCFVRRLKSAQTIDITGFILLRSVGGNGI